jgi:hypothetical protein
MRLLFRLLPDQVSPSSYSRFLNRFCVYDLFALGMAN